MVISLFLGAGKTASLVYLAWKNWYYRDQKIYSNLDLYKIPYIRVNTIEKLDRMREGMTVLDELWTILDARTSLSKKNRITSNILLRSRKRNLNYTFTTQLLSLIVKNVRNILDFTAYPMLNPNETAIKLIIFRGNTPKIQNIIKTIYIPTSLVFTLYDTNQEISIEDVEDDEINNKDVIVFQKDQESKPKLFGTWDDANEYASKYWERNSRILKYHNLI